MKRFSSGFFMLLFVLSLPPLAMGGEWVLVGQNDDFAVYLDSESTKMISETSSKVLVKIASRSRRYREGFVQFLKRKGLSVDGYRDFAYTIESLEMECSNDEHRILETADYDINGRKLGDSFPVSPWHHTSPNTIVAPIAAAVCSQHAESNYWWWDHPAHQSHEEE